MLLDFYEHNFRFSESARKKIEEIDSKNHLDHIYDIQKAFFQHKIKLCSAFARNRIKACALSLDAMLPSDIKEQKECGSRHPLCMWVNPLVSDTEFVLEKLRGEDFLIEKSLPVQEDEGQENMSAVCCYDETMPDLLMFPPWNKDDVYNSEMAINCTLIPMVSLFAHYMFN